MMMFKLTSPNFIGWSWKVVSREIAFPLIYVIDPIAKPLQLKHAPSREDIGHVQGSGDQPGSEPSAIAKRGHLHFFTSPWSPEIAKISELHFDDLQLRASKDCHGLIEFYLLACDNFLSSSAVAHEHRGDTRFMLDSIGWAPK